MSQSSKSLGVSAIRRLRPVVFVGSAALAAAIGVALVLQSPAPAALPEGCTIGALDRIGGPIDLVDETGAAVTQAAFTQRPTLLYFGFANCPDICPMALTTAGLALASRAKDAPPVGAALITVDPARDTPAFLNGYVRSGGFPPGLKGLTGSQTQVDAAIKAFAAYAAKVEQPNSALSYVMDHSSNFYLMDVRWKTVAIFPSTLKPQEMATCIDRALSTRAG